ncbi:hypothetical protein GCM10023200_19370 [Actinomycetospora chlora]|uniref:Uncharacterized protein n=1 Tax=Actinomycetospora chlora TaxID=663608 RepID=A0ABP9ATN8_9PSEU
MDDDELQRWIDEWSAQYPSAYDDSLAALEGIESLGHDDAEALYRWKFRGLWSKRKIKQMRAFPEPEIRELTRRAFLCEDELGALLILNLVPGLSAAGSSAVLAAQQPERYTVMDVRALASLIALDRWSREAQGARASAYTWLEYLATCRKISAETGCSLRTVDRALWKANGAVERR